MMGALSGTGARSSGWTSGKLNGHGMAYIARINMAGGRIAVSKLVRRSGSHYHAGQNSSRVILIPAAQGYRHNFANTFPLTRSRPLVKTS